MALTPGTRIGSYRIVDRIGSGGMGEVYRATDTKLGRDVAVKILPSALAQDPDRLARFEREAKLLATLNHVYIGAIYGLDDFEGTQFIAMELVEGQTLEERLQSGALPVEDALQIALQIAEALEAAHGKGVVHRDLKPANVMLTPDGVVKVLDFGLAKAFSGDPDEASPAHSPALSLAMTQQGLILGTAGYMSPEQASGQATDQRADIWAFGVVLYEMLTGLPLFSGESVPHILADVLRTDPDWGKLPKDLHPRLRLLLERCLEKKPRDRYHAIADARIDLEKILSDPDGLRSRSEPRETASGRRILPLAAVSIALAAVATSLLAWSLRTTPEPRAVIRFVHELPEGQLLRNSNRRLITISPDGRQFVYNTSEGLYLRELDELEARLIPGTEGYLTSPTFSPDGLWLAYWQGTQLKRIAVSGGAPALIADGVLNPFDLSWEADGTILFGRPEGIYRVPANGGTPELIITVDENNFAWVPELLPDGDTVLFSMGPPNNDDNAARVVVQSLSTGERTVLIEGGIDAHYLPTGHLVYGIDTGLFAVAFDPQTLTVVGGAVPLVQGVLRAAPGFANFDVSDDGLLVYARGVIGGEMRTLVWVDRAGREESISAPPRAYTSPRISPDGTRVALNARDQELDIWTWDFARETLTRLTFDPGQDRFPVWSPDGQRIAYSAQPSEGEDFVTAMEWRAADGTGIPERLADSSGQVFPHAFLPDATGIIVYGASSDAESDQDDDIGIFRFEGEIGYAPLLERAFGERTPDISPDGRWLAYASDESGSEEVYVRPFPDVDAGRWQVSTGGGAQPLWAPDGQELFYNDDQALFSVPIQTDPSFVAGNPRLLFEGPFFVGGMGGRNYDVAPDGERFLMIKPVESEADASDIVVVENWFEELSRMVPILDRD